MIRFLISALALCLLAGCASSNPAEGLQFGMTEDQVRDELGSKYKVVAASINKEGKQVTGWRYAGGKDEPDYMVYFVNGQLAQWGEAGALRAIPELGDPSAPKN